jgi:hypothetical protein
MINAKDFKEFAISAGADLVSAGPVSRLEGAPRQMDPRQAMPSAKTIIAFAFRLARGLFRGIEEGTFFSAYSAMGYANINNTNQTFVLSQAAGYLEDRGFEALPVTNPAAQKGANIMDSFGFLPPELASLPDPQISVPLREGAPPPQVFINQRLAAVCAGLGEMGYSKMFLTKKFGPRQRVCVMLTDAEFDEYDPVVPPGTICDRCKCCVKGCTGGAIPADKIVKIKLAGYDVEWADVDMEKCRIGLRGGNPRHNPFCVTEEDTRNLLQEIFTEGVHGSGKIKPYWGYARALEGASGCVRACMRHLEATGRVTNVFKNRFTQCKPWRINENIPLTDAVIEEARERGGRGLRKDLEQKLKALKMDAPVPPKSGGDSIFSEADN